VLDTKHGRKHWAKRDRKIKKDVVFEDVKRIVTKWYFEETRISPNKKDVLRCQVAHKTWETHATHFFQENEARYQFPPCSYHFLHFHSIKYS
jgi:hypothetical protein